MLYTSGTTGRPKGVYRRQAPPASRLAQSISQVSKYQPDGDRMLCTGPLYHAAPLAFNLAAPLAASIGTVLMDRWDAAEALRLIEKHRITHTHMVATMFHRLLALPDDVKAQLRDPHSDRYTIEGIGASAGFRSRSALYDAFHRREGMTPTAFRAAIRRTAGD